VTQAGARADDRVGHQLCGKERIPPHRADDQAPERQQVVRVLVAISAVTAEAAAVVTATTGDAVVSAIVERIVMATVMVAAGTTVVGEVAGSDEPVHHEGDTAYRSIPLFARLRFAKDAPNHKHATGTSHMKAV